MNTALTPVLKPVTRTTGSLPSPHPPPPPHPRCCTTLQDATSTPQTPQPVVVDPDVRVTCARAARSLERCLSCDRCPPSARPPINGHAIRPRSRRRRVAGATASPASETPGRRWLGAATASANLPSSLSSSWSVPRLLWLQLFAVIFYLVGWFYIEVLAHLCAVSSELFCATIAAHAF